MTFDSICGNCLHAKSSHAEISKTLMYCPICFKSCDMTDFNMILKPSGSIVQDGKAYQIRIDKNEK